MYKTDNLPVKSPQTCLLTVTNNCVLRCKMCHLWQLNTLNDEIDIDECKGFIDSLGQFGSKPLEVHLIGGESLIKKGILELIKYISAKGSRTVMTSCGYTIDGPMAEALVDSGLNMLNLSLDSLDPSIHNFLRGKDDSYKRLMDAIGHLSRFKKDRLKLGINTVISAVNLERLVELAEWVGENRNLDSIYFMAVMRPFGSDVDWDWYGREEFNFLWPQDIERVNSVINRLVGLKRSGSKIENPVRQLEDFRSYFYDPQKFIKNRRCNLTHHAINVNAIGDIYLCFFMERLGNIRDANIKDLWTSTKAAEIRKTMLHCQKNCELVVNCYYEE